MGLQTLSCQIWPLPVRDINRQTICASSHSAKRQLIFRLTSSKREDIVAKVLAGGAESLQKILKQRFSKVSHLKPPASRADSSEKFVVATGYRLNGRFLDNSRGDTLSADEMQLNAAAFHIPIKRYLGHTKRRAFHKLTGVCKADMAIYLNGVAPKPP